MDMSAFSDERPDAVLRLLFIHHSCGGQLLAEPGDAVGENCMFRTHPNGGGLRRLLEEQGYEVHEASYGSEVGEATDVFDWLPKFRDSLGKVITCAHQNTYYADGLRNHIVVFKSCFPNSNFAGEGEPPGCAEGPDLTVWNAKSAYSALLEELRGEPRVLFVCVTTPPLVRKLKPEPAWKRAVRMILGKPRLTPRPESGRHARAFADWLKGEGGWLKDYQERNVVVFDLYDILTGEGASDYLEYPTGGGHDSHPAREGNERCARAFVPFVNRAVRRLGLVR